MRLSCCVLAALLGTHLSAVSAAGVAFPDGPKIAVHIQLHSTTKGVSPCDISPTESMLACSGYTTHGDVGKGYFLYIVVGQADSSGIGGATFGIDYDGLHGQGVDIVGNWILCASGIQFPSAGWPGAGSGNVLTWNPQTACGRTFIDPDGAQATAGLFYVFVYSEDRFAVTPHKLLVSGPTLTVANCMSVERDLPVESAGYVDFGGTAETNPGYNPCGSVPTRPITWGRLKATY